MAFNAPVIQNERQEQDSQILLFGDLSLIQFEEQFRRTLHVKTNALLISFLDRVNYAIRRLVENLPLEQQVLFPRFTTLIDLVSKLGETEGTPVLRFFLLSVHEIAQFIVYYGSGSKSYPSPSNTFVVGPCTGGFAAAAISCSQSLPDIIPNGVEAAKAAFRTALRSFLVGQSLSRIQAAQPKSWSVVLNAQKDEDLEEILKEYTSTQTPLQQSPLWISATGKATTLSGRPLILQDFVTKNASKLKSPRYLDVESPYHAGHLFDDDDVEDIIGEADETEQQTVRIPFISSSNGQVVEAGNLTSVLRVVIQEALRDAVRWDLILATCQNLFTSPEDQKCTILPFSSHAASMVSTSLSKDIGVQVFVEDTASQFPSHIPKEPSGRFEHSKIAIIGYSGRFPSAASNEAFWELLKAGRDVHREIPADRFDWKAHYDPTGKTKNTSRVKYGCFIDEPGLFDTRFFSMSPREAENTDPAQRLAITTTYEAMEMAGMVLNRTPSTQQDRVGVFFGTTSDDWREVNSGQDVGTYFIPGGNRAFVPGRISYFFRFSGPSLSVDTACSSSFAAIQAACTYLWKGDVDTAVAGGTNVLTNPDNFAGLDRGHFLSTTGNCNAFDDAASGYCRSDAVGSVILKRVEDAIADKDPIFGVIVGTNTNHCGQTDSITRPHEGDQTSVFKRIMRHSNVDPLDVNYIEMHGTGTQAGDATEMRSVLSTFMPASKDRTSSPLHLGSAKANIGHAESASGVTSLIKVLMMMKHSEIPPHVGIKTRINHTYPTDLAERGVKIALKPTPWTNGKRAAFLNNFSAAGGNTAMLIEDAPKLQQVVAAKDPRSVHVIAVTAKSPKAMAANVNSLISYIDKNPSVSLGALSYTTTARRMHHSFRVLVSGADTVSVRSALESVQTKDIKPVSKKPTRVIFAFSGQGTLFAGLAKSLFDSNATFRARIVELNRIARHQGFPSFLGHIDASTPIPATEVASHLALVCIQIALSDLWRSWGVLPAAVIGHSLGEYAALYAAGVLSVVDAIYLVGIRATLLEKRCTAGTHAMLAIRASLEHVEQLLQSTADSDGKCELACANQPTGHVIAGPLKKVSDIARAATDSGLEVIRLEIPFAFHSAQIDPIMSEFGKAAAQGVTYHPPTVPVFSPLRAKVIPAGNVDKLNASYLVAACRGMVDFSGALLAARQADSGLDTDRTIWLEIGPHSVCGGMVKGTFGSQSKTIPTLRKGVDAYKTVSTALEMMYLTGVEVNWNEYHRDFPAAQQVLDLPRYSWDLNNYWIQYRNNFTLTKGDGMVQRLAIEAPAAAVEPKPVPKYISPSAQQVIEESHGPEESSLVVQSNIYDPRLVSVLQDHRVNGAALCPSSLWADVALTVANYMLVNSPNNVDIDTTGLDVANVAVDKPLLAVPGETTRLFRASATTKWFSNTISMAIFSVDGNGKRTASHCTVDVHITPQQRWLSEWKRNTHFITSRIDSLAQSQDSHMIRRGMAYKLFGALVEYSKEYQGMSEVILDSKLLEAVSTVNFQVGSQGFHLNPKWIDSLGHIAGFIMNANDDVDSKTTAFINHGWERMRMAEPIREDKTYRVYNRMQLVEKITYSGDTYILDNDRIVAIFEGVTFQGVPRRVLDHFFPTGKAATPAARPAATASPAQRATPTSVPAPAARSAAPVVKAASTPQATVKGKSPGPSSSVVGRILAVISEEVGVAIAELKPDSEFADLGIDSLLSLTITSKIREELGLDFPSTLFIDHPTVGDLQVLAGGDGSGGGTTGYSSAEDSQDTALTIPSEADSDEETPVQDVTSERDRVALVVRQIISEEVGVAIGELLPSTNLMDMGVDSLLSLTIVAKVQELLNVDMPDFMSLETVQDVEDELCKSLGLDKPISKKPSPPRRRTTSFAEPQLTQQLSGPQQPVSDPSLPRASSILLSGSPKSASLILFLFPDGSGSASSYATVAPTIDPSKIAVYGLNCPWRKTGAEMTRLGITMSTMVHQYIDELKRRLVGTTHLPFALGGWSAGGILALEAARQLPAYHSLHPSHIVLLDSPNPIGLQNPPQRMYDFFDSLGIFGEGGKTPDWLRKHFDAFIRILDEYEPRHLPDAPASLIVYARDGVCKDPSGPKMEIRPDDPREMVWLLNDRTDFEAGGWKSVVGSERMRVEVVDQVNHFTIMEQKEEVRKVGGFISEFLLGGR
ncbi:polyketide synthase [Lophiostoma macrostomum CBS 122681]|uniref:Polyketide synthase n=1 Tax=Lophiostoma macrostomum CBS 122681 TaxID=1314788 RepID=A0A6A6T6T1_9PLEO|nr:polyketide synthase [Lophiostoma macrostomum CBS 122681]